MKKYLRYLIPLVWALLIWRLTTSAQIVVTTDSWLQNILMDVAHFTFFGIQAVLLSLSLASLSSITLASLYGALIEWRQIYVPGRTADPFDWMLDTLGAIIFVYFFIKLKSSKV